MATKLPGFTPVQPSVSLADALISQLRDQIIDGRLALGAQLPTEQELMEAFGVSRTVVREALAALRSDGLVTARQGRGVFVAASLENQPFKIDVKQVGSLDNMLQIMELRMTVELEAAALAAERRTQADLDVLEACLDSIQRAIDAGEEAIEADFQFHCAIAAATKNPYFADILRYLGRIVIPPRAPERSMFDDATMRDYLIAVQSEHQEIEAAIRNQDSDAARNAVRQHLTKGRERHKKLVTESARTRQGHR